MVNSKIKSDSRDIGVRADLEGICEVKSNSLLKDPMKKWKEFNNVFERVAQRGW